MHQLSAVTGSSEGDLDGEHSSALIVRPAEQALNFPGVQALEQLLQQLRALCQQSFLVRTASLLQ